MTDRLWVFLTTQAQQQALLLAAFSFLLTIIAAFGGLDQMGLVALSVGPVIVAVLLPA